MKLYTKGEFYQEGIIRDLEKNIATPPKFSFKEKYGITLM
jgi:hypothetical protein